MENEITTPEGGTLILQPIDQEIKKAYSLDDPRTKACVTAIENNLASIKVRRDGFTQYSLKH